MAEKMETQLIRAYIWQDIIRLGFTPSSSRDQKNWLHLYGKSLRNFWEVEKYPSSPKEKKGIISATIDSSSDLGFTFEYAIETNNKFTIRLMHFPPTKIQQLMWLHDMDGSYFSFPVQQFLTKYNKRRDAVGAMSEEDIVAVMDALILHPTPHQHIESPIDRHSIRIGGGITNPFLYLFHLRIQLCIDETMRKSEKERLVALFKQAIEADEKISANALLKTSN